MPRTSRPRHEEVLDGLVRLFLKEGFRKFTLAELAADLRCSKTTLYALGHSKEALVVNALIHFFNQAALRVDARTHREAEPSARLVAYLRAVADELRPASKAFLTDMAEHPAARAVYERNTRYAADRVRALVAEGKDDGSFRSVDADFVGHVVAETMVRIQSGGLARATGLGDADAYDELASLVLRGISNPPGPDRSHAAFKPSSR
jgi:AcrR family transcriptional regulator